jgi:hypothetical protein
MELYLICLGVGFAVGFGVRSVISQHRRARIRRKRIEAGLWFKKIGAAKTALKATATTTRDGLRKSRPPPVSLPVRSDF